MKKLFFFLALVLATSMAMAQIDTVNVANTTQDGNQNDALVKQIGSDLYGSVQQFGNSNDAYVKQNGKENMGVVDQIRGDRNDGFVTQTGNKNQGYIQQGLTTDYYDDYTGTANAPTGYNLYANDNNAAVTQSGNENFSSIGQWGHHNTGSSIQEGNGNDIYIYQGWEGSWWGGPALYSTNSKVDIKQYQDANSARVWQYGGDNNTTNVLQNGTSNLISVTQGWIYTDLNYDFSAPVLNTKNNFVSIEQIGNSNKAKMMQLGDNNLFKLSQSGNNNEVGYFAGNLEPSRNAYFTQDGDNNKVAGVYKNASDDLAFWESQDAEQFNGAILSYESYQTGNLNIIGLRQGMDDMATIQQDGIGNEALLYQYGADRNVANMMQFGNNNTSQVVQIQQ